MMVFDVDEDLEKDIEENGFKGFPMDIDFVKVEDFKPEMDETEQLILPDGLPVINEGVLSGIDDKILPDRDEGSNSSDDPVKHEPLDIDTGLDEELILDPEADGDLEHLSGLSSSKNTKKRGRKVRVRTVRPNCDCSLQCGTRVSDEVRQKLLENLLQKSRTEQRKFVNDHICILPTSRARSLNSRRSFTYYYFLPVESGLVKVCKTMFLNTYALTDRILRRILVEKVTDRHVVCGNPNFPVLLKKCSKLHFEYDEVYVPPQQVREDRCKCDLQCGRSFPKEVIAQIQSCFGGKSKEEQNDFLSRHIKLSSDKRVRYMSAIFRARFFLPHESTVKEVCRKTFLHTFQLTTGQVKPLLNKLPDNPDLPVDEWDGNISDVELEILPEDNSLNDPVKHEPLDIESEMNQSQSEQQEFLVVLPRDEDSVDEELFLDPEAGEHQDHHSNTDSQEETLPSEIQEAGTSKGFSAGKLRRECKTRGLSYTSRSGRIIPARTVKPNCGDACQYQCRTRVSDEVRQELLAHLLQLSRSDQCKFINDHICIKPPARRRKVDSRRALTYYFFLPVESRLVKVCKKMFINTYDFTETMLRITVAKKRVNKHVVCGNPNFPVLLKSWGKFYFDYDEAKVVPHKVRKEWCECSQQCGRVFPEEVIAQILGSFREKSEKELNDFLYRHVQLMTDEGKQHKSPLFRARFFLPLESTVKEVCRKMFLHTLELTTSQVRSVLNNLPENPDLQVKVEDPSEHAVNDTEVLYENGPHEDSDPLIDPVKAEPLDFKIEMDEAAEFVVALPRDDDSVDEELLVEPEVDDEDQGDRSDTDNQSEVISSDIVPACHLVLPSSKSATNIRKERKMRGLSYITHDGRLIPARAVRQNCGATCKIQCRTRVSEEVRQQLLVNLFQMSLSDQWKYIYDHICIMPAAKPRSVSGRRTLSWHYFLPVESRLVKVCRTMFINTFDITKDTLFKNLATKIGAKHAVCGNPNFPPLLRKGSKFYFEYDEAGGDQKVEEVLQTECECDLQCDGTFSEQVIEQIQSSFREKSIKEQHKFLSEHVQLSASKRKRYKRAIDQALFFLPLGTTVKEVCRKVFTRTLKLTTCQLRSLLNNLPENLDMTVKVEDSLEVAVNDAEPLMDVVPCPDPLDSKIEMDEFMVPLPRDDDSVDEELLVEPEADGDQGDHSDTDNQSEVLSSDIQGKVSCRRKSAANIRKERKIRGLSYISHDGRLIPARAVKPNCGTTCKIQCRTRVSEEVRQQLLVNLLQMSLGDQWKYIFDHICNMPAAKPRSLSGRRTLSCHYFLPVESRLVKVCRTMFVNTYDISKVALFKNLGKKIGARHAVCGNPNFPPLLSKGNKFYFEYDEGCDQEEKASQEVREVECECDLQCGGTFSKELIDQIQSSFRKMSIKLQNKFLSEHVQLSAGKRKRYKSAIYQARFFLPLGSTVKEVCRKVFMCTFKLTTMQVGTLLNNLSDNPNLPDEVLDPFELAKEHIAALRMEEDHHCAVSGNLWKLSRCPNVARVYSEYLEVCQEGVEPIDYRQFYAMFSKTFMKTGLLLPTRCPDCGFFDRGESG